MTAYLRALGDPVTRLDRIEPALNETKPGDVRDTTTPSAMANLLARLVRDPILSNASKQTLFGWMRGADTGLTRIRAGVPPGWTVGDKTGTTNSGGNDVAILWPRTGAPIVLAVYFAEVRGSDAERDAAIAGRRAQRRAPSSRLAGDDVREDRVEAVLGDPGDLEQLIDRRERTVRGAERDDPLARARRRSRGSSRASARPRC